MAEGPSQRFLEFQISNKTRNNTLVYHRFETPFDSPPQLRLELPPGSSDCCRVLSSSEFSLGLLVYEAESFSVAIFIFTHRGLPSALQLELALDKAHLRDLCRTFVRMASLAEAPSSGSTATVRCRLSGQGEVSVPLSAGRYEVTATVSRGARPFLGVRVEERGGRRFK